MCIQVVERYAICGCLYYKHAVDKCEDYIERPHEVQAREVLVGYTCSEHTSSSVYRPSGARARRQVPENYQSNTELEPRSGSPVSAQSEGLHKDVEDWSDNGPAVGSDEFMIQRGSIIQSLCFTSDSGDADTDAPLRDLFRDLLWRSLPFYGIDFDAPNQNSLWPSPRTDTVNPCGSHHGQSEVQASTASPGQLFTGHAPFSGVNNCPHHLMQSAGACPRECCWVLEQSIESCNATTDISRRQFYHLLRDSLTIAFAKLSRGGGLMAVIQSSNSCQGTNSNTITDTIELDTLQSDTITDTIELDTLQSDRNTDASTSHAAQLPTANLVELQETQSAFTATSDSRKTEKWPSIPPCYLLIFLGFLTVVGSLVPGLWRASSRNDLSGGFSLAQYILGVGIFIVGSMVAIHSKNCECWKTHSGVGLVVGASH